MTTRAVPAVTVADQKVAAWLFKQVEAEVLGPHCGLKLHNVMCAYDIAQQMAGELRVLRMINGWRVFTSKLKFAPGFKSQTRRLGNMPHSTLDQVQHLQCERPHCAADLA